MAFKVFLDANVLLDFLLKRDQYGDARNIMSLVIEGKYFKGQEISKVRNP